MLKLEHMSKKPIVLMVAAFFGLGMSMPSCPGQQAMQQQIDTLTQQNADLTRRLMAIDGRLKPVEADMSQVKQLLKPMSDAIQAQKAAMDQLDANIKNIQAKLAAPPPKPAKNQETLVNYSKRSRGLHSPPPA